MTGKNQQQTDKFVADEVGALRNYFKERDVTPRVALLITSSFIGHLLLAQHDGDAAKALSDLQSLTGALGKDIISTALTWARGEHDNARRQLTN
jgi:hypothetical protein